MILERCESLSTTNLWKGFSTDASRRFLGKGSFS